MILKKVPKVILAFMLQYYLARKMCSTLVLLAGQIQSSQKH